MELRGRLVALGLTLVTISIARAEISPWPMFRHDIRHTGCTPYTGPAAPTVQWVLTANDAITSSPSLGPDGTIYVGSGGYFGSTSDSSFYAVNPDGTLKWRYPTEQGVFSSPAVRDDGSILFGSLDYHLYAVEDAGTHGELLWQTHLGHRVYSSPTVGADGSIYIGCLNFNIYGLHHDGHVKWSHHTDWCVFSSPALGPEGEIYIGSKDEHLYALEDSVTYGKLRWQHATGRFYDGHLVDSSPAVGPDGTIYVGTDPYGAIGQTPVPVDTVFFAVNPDGTRKWSFVMGDGAESAPAIGPDGTVYVGSYDGNLYAIRDDGYVGTALWVFPTGGWIDGSPAVDACGTIYVGSRDSTLYAINPDGTLRWSLATNGGIESSPAIDDRGILYVGTMSGDLYAVGTAGPDVGVTSIDLPVEVEVNAVHIPAATVSNYRAGAASFAVACLIDRAGLLVYGDTVQVSDLAETTAVVLTFDPWIVGADSCALYTATFHALLPGDNNSYNDERSARVRSVCGPAGVRDTAGSDRESRVLFDGCAPNPFHADTRFDFSIAALPEHKPGEAPEVSLRIYDLAGRLIRTLVAEPRAAGSYSAVWDGRDDRGVSVARGVHLCRLRVGQSVATRKVLYLQ